MTFRAPLIIAVVLLLLPALYVASYFAIVDPPSRMKVAAQRIRDSQDVNYRAGGDWPASFFWPLELADRRLRSERWTRWFPDEPE